MSLPESDHILQTCLWFHRIIKNFGDISRPLAVLTKKSDQWQWRSQQKNAFNQSR